MVNTFLRWMLLASCLISASAMAASLSNLSVAGIKTGMTPEQAIDGLANQLNINKKDIEFKVHNTMAFIDYATGDEKYAINFAKDYLNSDGSTFAVYSVKYDNTKDIQKAILAKYGEPNSDRSGRFYWCDDKDCTEPAEGYPSLRGTKHSLYLSTSQLSIAEVMYKLKQGNDAKNANF